MGEHQQKIKVAVAGRVYPLSVPPEREAQVRKAASEIDEQLRKFEARYSVQDQQDLLAMYALQAATKLSDEDLTHRLNSIESQLDAALNANSH